MTTTITLNAGGLHRWTEIEGEATAEYQNSLLRCRRSFAQNTAFHTITGCPGILLEDLGTGTWKQACQT
jgi:hypothetical protein